MTGPTVRIDIVSVFPEYLAPLELSLIGKARGSGLLDISVFDLRQWTYDVHHSVDDSPYGGGPGMVMRAQPWGEAIDALIDRIDRSGQGDRADQGDRARPVRPCLVVPSPAGQLFTQTTARELAALPYLIFACGRYEGIDERVVEYASTRAEVRELSIGDYVLFGGEAATLVMVEAITRLIPGVLGNADSLIEESHTGGLLEAPMYTKPASWRGYDVPEILRSGDHGRIAEWRREQAMLRTARRRPDLLGDRAMSPEITTDRDVWRGGFPVAEDDMAK